MTKTYIPRTLICNRGHDDEREITEADIPSINGPIVILGDPGLGKTELTTTLEGRFGFKRVTGGAFYRNQNVARYRTPPNSKLIIDGLDEITSSSGVSAIDEVLKKLSEAGNPDFILSCRSADWQGSTDRYKINEDYGIEPVTLHLQPFTYEDATTFLLSYDEKIDVERVLDYLDQHDLREFYINPLTLTLVAEIATAGEGLPKGRADLLDRASKLLTYERNPIHQRSSVAQFNRDALLDSAGAALAHLLISGSIGFSDRPQDETPDGYVYVGEVSDIPGAPHASASIRTRLFQSSDENLYIPFHRVVAEYLGARWLSKRVSNGLSERRLFQALVFDGGVPTALRGLHAWLAHFSSRLATRCIRTDPYGVLRYGEPDQLPLDQARLLLRSLASLANDDPYFRSEDWGRRAVSGLARPELKNEVVDIITSQDRPIHLSMLLLEALQGSPLADSISDKLIALVESASAAYAERSHAAEALIGAGVDVDWPTIAETLRVRSQSGDKRLILEIIVVLGGNQFSPQQMANAILEYRPSTLDDDDADPYVSGMVYRIAESLSPEKAGEVLDEISRLIETENKSNEPRLGYELSSAINQLVDKAIQNDEKISPERIWSWLKLTEDETGYSRTQNRPTTVWLLKNQDVRRQIQLNVINASGRTDGPWLAIAHDLPAADPGLALTPSDAANILTEIASKAALVSFDSNVWIDVVQSQQHLEGFPDEISAAISVGTSRHPLLSKLWQQLITTPKRDWKKEERIRAAERERILATRYTKHQAIYRPRLMNIASGKDLAALAEIAKAYLGRYIDSKRDSSPEDRVRDWLGTEIADAAFAGFIAALFRNDIPDVRKLSETHAEGKYHFIELVLICGVAELMRAGRHLVELSAKTASTALAGWWENAERFDEKIQGQLEDIVFVSDDIIEDFLATMMEPRIRAGHQHVPGLYRIAHDNRFRNVAGQLCVRWLKDFPTANASIQTILAKTAINDGLSSELVPIARDRISNLQAHSLEAQRLWTSVAYIVDFETSKDIYSTYFKFEKRCLWSLAELVQAERHHHRALLSLTVEQREFLISTFGPLWPSVPRPSSTVGSFHPWDASDFIRVNINAIGANSAVQASESLDRIASLPAISSYQDHAKHIRASQLRLRRDAEFHTSPFKQVKKTLAGELPGNIDDLKAVILDRLEFVQDYIRNGNTSAWEAFWSNDRPKDENTCRDRLLDHLASQIPVEIHFLPEIVMPDATRADIVAIYNGNAVPMEIKGQWHKNVWDAASVQLIEQYTRDWRADDRGIYLVLWFGNVPGKNLTRHPEGLPRPSSPTELREMLLSRLSPIENTRIDILVLDVSKP